MLRWTHFFTQKFESKIHQLFLYKELKHLKGFENALNILNTENVFEPEEFRIMCTRERQLINKTMYKIFRYPGVDERMHMHYTLPH